MFHYCKKLNVCFILSNLLLLELSYCHIYTATTATAAAATQLLRHVTAGRHRRSTSVNPNTTQSTIGINAHLDV